MACQVVFKIRKVLLEEEFPHWVNFGKFVEYLGSCICIKHLLKKTVFFYGKTGIQLKSPYSHFALRCTAKQCCM